MPAGSAVAATVVCLLSVALAERWASLQQYFTDSCSNDTGEYWPDNAAIASLQPADALTNQPMSRFHRHVLQRPQLQALPEYMVSPGQITSLSDLHRYFLTRHDSLLSSAFLAVEDQHSIILSQQSTSLCLLQVSQLTSLCYHRQNL